jgi:hypothetical protein
VNFLLKIEDFASRFVIGRVQQLADFRDAGLQALTEVGIRELVNEAAWRQLAKSFADRALHQRYLSRHEWNLSGVVAPVRND